MDQLDLVFDKIFGKEDRPLHSIENIFLSVSLKGSFTFNEFEEQDSKAPCVYFMSVGFS